MNYLFLAILSAAFILIECLLGGTRLLFSLPTYALLGAISILTVFAWKRQRVMPRPACLISSAVFFAYILARTWWSPVDYLARDDFYMVLGSLAVYLLTAQCLVKSHYRMLFLAVLLAIALGEIAVAMVQFSKGSDFMLFGYQRFPNGHRGSGQYVSPNHLAGYLEVVGVMGLSLVFWSTWRPWAKIMAGYASLVALGGVMITGSRGGYLSTAFCLVVFCALNLTVVKIAFPDRFLRIVLIGGAVVLLAGGSLPFLVTSDLVRQRSGQIFVKDMRLKLWAAAWTETKLDPVFGMGSGSYLYYGRKFRDPEVQTDPVRAHNDYLDMLAEYGFAGGLGMIVFLVFHLWNGLHTFFWLVRKKLQFASDWRSSSLALNIGSLCAVAAYLVHSIFDFNLHIPANSLLMAFVFGILANPGLETFHGQKAAAVTNKVFQWLLPVLGVALMALTIPKIPGEYYTEKARVALRDQHFADAAVAAKAGIAWEKKNPDLYYYYGEAKRSMGNGFPPALAQSFYKSASEAFGHGLELFPQDVRLLLIEGWTQDAMGHSDEAEKYFQQALEWDPNWLPVQRGYQIHLNIVKATAAQPPPVP